MREYMWGSKTAHRRRSPTSWRVGADGGAHLRRMVRVVVVDDHAGSIRDQLHPPSGSGERLQPLRQRVQWGAQLTRQGQGGRGIEHVVLPRQAHFERLFEQAEGRSPARVSSTSRACTSPPGP